MEQINQNNKVSAFCDDVLGDLDGVALTALIKSGQVSSKAMVSAAIERAKSVNPRLNAIALQSFDKALVNAEKNASQNEQSNFAGLPTFVKDNEMVAGLPVRHGSEATSKQIVKKSSRFVKEFLSTGLISLGKTRLPEFGLTATTESLVQGATLNPWNSEYSSGGSSGGSAALVASGVVPFAHANDGGGSIRIPAACCGLVGLKPTRGRLAHMAGTEAMPINIVQQGIVSRSVRDTCSFYAGAEKVYRNPDLPALGYVERPGKQRLRIGFFAQHPSGAAIDPINREIAEQTAKLCESLGHKVEEVSYPVQPSSGEDFLLYWASQAFFIKNFGGRLFGKPFDKKQLEPLTLGLSKLFAKKFYLAPFVIRRLKKLAIQFDAFYQQYDILLSPIQAHPTPKIGFLGPDLDPELILQRLSSYVPFTAAQNVTGGPAISLPLGMTQEGLPVGIQFASAFGQDKKLLELALELEKARPWASLSDTDNQSEKSMADHV